MAFSISSIFGGQPASAPQAPAAPAPQPQGNIPEAPTVNADPNNPTAPVAAPQAPQEPESPLDNFKSLWETPPVDPKNPSAPAQPVALTPEEVQKAVAGADFSKFVTPEQLANVTSGGENAASSLMEILNTIGRQSLAQATMVGNNLSNKAIEQALKNHSASLPDLVRRHSTTNHMKETNPIFSNPAVQPVVEATMDQLRTKFPNASNEELTAKTQAYITAMGQAFAPPEAVITDPNEQNWDTFLQ